MKKRILFIGMFFGLMIGMHSCCDCINCPGYGQTSGTGSDNICRDQYEASGASQQITWQNYSYTLVQNGGCSCR